MSYHHHHDFIGVLVIVWVISFALGIVLVVVGAPFWALASLTQSPTNHLLFSVPMCQSNTTASTWVGVDLINTGE